MTAKKTKKKMKKKLLNKKLSNNIKYKRLTKESQYGTNKKKTGFKKSYFFYSKQHQDYINFDKKHHEGEGNFLYSKFTTYINVIPFSRPPFFFAMYLGIIVPQMLFLFKRLKKNGPYLNWVKIVLALTIGFALLTLFYWFFDLFIETRKIGKHNQKINASLSYGFTIFMLSEICVFGGLFWGFFDRAFHPSVSLQSLYMPSGTHGLPSLGLVFRGSLLLSLSCTAFNAMKRALMLGENNRARFWGFLSFCIGLAFLFQQMEEYESIPYMMSLNAHCSFFYAITGLHGFHVAIGILFIGTILDRISKEQFNQYELMSVTFAEIYWYFVDLVWFVLLIALYAYGLYHPNCVLFEKYTWADQLKEYMYISGQLFRDYLEGYLCCEVNKDFYLSWSEKFQIVTYYYLDLFNWFRSYITFLISDPSNAFFWSVKQVVTTFFFFFNPTFIDFYIFYITDYILHIDFIFMYSFLELFVRHPINTTIFLIDLVVDSTFNLFVVRVTLDIIYLLHHAYDMLMDYIKG